MLNSSQRPAEIDRLIGNNLRRIRQERKIPLASLASALGLSPQKLSNHENGLTPISSGLLFCASEELDVPINSFFPLVHAANQNDVSNNRR